MGKSTIEASINVLCDQLLIYREGHNDSENLMINRTV